MKLFTIVFAFFAVPAFAVCPFVGEVVPSQWPAGVNVEVELRGGNLSPDTYVAVAGATILNPAEAVSDDMIAIKISPNFGAEYVSFKVVNDGCPSYLFGDDVTQNAIEIIQ